MAKRKNDIIAVKDFTDPDTGDVIQLTGDDEKAIQLCEQEIKVGFLRIAFALKTIRDRKLYFLRECTSMRQYISDHLDYSYAKGMRLMSIADAYKDADPDLLEQFSQGTLLELARNPELAAEVQGAEVGDGEVRLPDGEVMGYKEFVNKITRELGKLAEERESKHVKKLAVQKDQLHGKDELLKLYEERLQESEQKNKDLQKAMMDLTMRKDVDPRKLVFITQKKEALRLVDEVETRFVQILGDAIGVPHELLDPEISMKITHMIASLDAGLIRLREYYGAAMYIPALAQRPDDVVPR